MTGEPNQSVPTSPQRRTIVIGEPAADAAPGTGRPIDPLLVPAPDDSRSSASRSAGLGRSSPGGGRKSSGDDATAQIPGSTGTVTRRTGTGGSTDGTGGPSTEAGPLGDGVGGEPRVVVIGGDDDLPDASYTAQSSRSPDEPRGPRVHPRLKARRFGVGGRGAGRRIWWTAVLGGVVLLAIVAVGVLSTPLFAITKINVSGVVYTDQESVNDITDSIRSKPILTADLNGVRRRLEELPWVKYATEIGRAHV